LREKVYLTYPPKLLKEPVIYQIGQKFRVVTISAARTSPPKSAWSRSSSTVDEADVTAAIHWLREIGVQVERSRKTSSSSRVLTPPASIERRSGIERPVFVRLDVLPRGFGCATRH